MTGERTYPMLPCADLDDALEFYTALGFTVSFQQRRPYPCAVVELDDIAIHLFAMDGFDPATGMAVPGKSSNETSTAAGAAVAYAVAKGDMKLVTPFSGDIDIKGIVV